MHVPQLLEPRCCLRALRIMVSEGVELGYHDAALQGALALASTCSAQRAPCPGHWLQSARWGHWGHWNSRDPSYGARVPLGGI